MTEKSFRGGRNVVILPSIFSEAMKGGSLETAASGKEKGILKQQRTVATGATTTSTLRSTYVRVS